MSKNFTHLSDFQWETIKGLVDWAPPPQRGVPRADFRKIWNSILFVLTRGCRWSDIPSNPALYCSKSTAHRWLLILKKAHVFDKVLSGFLQAGIAANKIDLAQVAVDGSFSPGAWWRERNRARI
jgi:transposase